MSEPSRILAPAGDGWWPVLAPSANLVAFGNTDLRVVDLRSGGTWPIGAGRHLRFLDDVFITWTRDLDATGTRAQRWTADLRSWAGGWPSADDPQLVAANQFDARDRHWASWLDASKRIVRDGAVLCYDARGVSCHGDELLTVRHETEFVVYRSGVIARTLPLPANANSWRLSARGWIVFGYWGPTRAYTDADVTVDLTVTPYAKESVAALVWTPDSELWVWTATERPTDLRRALLGRPYGSTDVVLIENDGLVALDAGWSADLGGFIVAGCTDRGQCVVYRVPRDATRVPITTWAGGTPPDPPTPPVSTLHRPGVAIVSYDKTLTASTTWRAEVRDAKNPGFSYTVEFVTGSFHFTMRNPAGEDRSASQRKVTID